MPEGVRAKKKLQCICPARTMREIVGGISDAPGKRPLPLQIPGSLTLPFEGIIFKFYG
jgi:hypothetical protein